VIFRQFINDDLGCASYLVGDEHAGVAAVVDPRLEVDEYLRLARFAGVEIAHILETHTHADHVSGHGRLAEATGATIHVNRLAGAAYPHEPIDDGWELGLGEVRVRALHTPGHRPEHTCFCLTDTSRGDGPWAVLTGDSLFVGGVARPDLAVEPREGARGIFRSLHGALLALAPEVEVWPGHLGGSMCGGPGMSQKISSTIGYERFHNALLGDISEEAFVERSLAELGPQPPNFREIVEINRGPLASLDVHDRPLAAGQLLARQADGALVVDVRTDLLFDDAHIPGAISVTAQRAGFGTRLAWLVGPGREVVFVGRDDEEARTAARLAAAVGVRGGVGHLAGGMSSWRTERRPVERIARVTVPELAARRAADPRLQVLDVREPADWDAGRIPGSVNLPYPRLEETPLDLDLERPIAVICAVGHRSAVGASLLQRRGAVEALHVVDGGVADWGELGHPLEAAAD
jgi:glyoxylase-like metal-dependent hydrolase (beta-lactamase superfamily II)/rhodanese-related sulfurtransferase